MTSLCTTRLIGPLQRVLESRHGPCEALTPLLRPIGTQERAPVDVVHEVYDRAVAYTGDPLLGLRVGERMSVGELGPLDYLMRSAPTVRDSLEAAARYSPLQSDSFRIIQERWRGGGLVRLVDEGCWTRTVGDVALSSGYRCHVGLRAPFTSRLECWFPYPAPTDTSLHRRIFEGATLRFDAPFFAYAFDPSYESAPQPGADAGVHELLRQRFDAVLADVERASRLQTRVRRAIEQQLRDERQAPAAAVARELGIGRRTLSRRLEDEGTTFSDQLDEVRKELALAHVCDSERPLAEVAFLLGFSHVESFHRAFKRWTGTTPLARRSQARQEQARVH